MNQVNNIPQISRPDDPNRVEKGQKPAQPTTLPKVTPPPPPPGPVKK